MNENIELFWENFINDNTTYLNVKIPESFYFCDNEKDANYCAKLVVKNIKQAKNQYGVVLSKEGLAIDLYETKKLRASRPRASEMFHRGEYYNAEDDRTPQNQ